MTDTSPTDKQVERVAKAIHAADPVHKRETWDDVSGHYRFMARAALSAMPSTSEQNSGCPNTWDQS